MRTIGLFARVAWVLSVCAPGWSIDIEWTRMTGQTPVESAPLVADVNNDGAMDIVAVNRSGQVMRWATDGSARGAGQDGMVARLPDGDWTSTPVRVTSAGPARLLVCSIEGLVVALDGNYQTVWQRALPGKTTWARALPAAIATPVGHGYCFGDHSGTVTCLSTGGKVVWSKALAKGPCRAPLSACSLGTAQSGVLVAVGSTLCRLDAAGKLLWQRDLGGKILTRPEVLNITDQPIIVCGAGAGSLVGLSAQGEILWRSEIGDEIDTSIAVLPRSNARPLILCTGLWGNLHAIDVEGHHIWTHRYRAKGRAVPCIVDTDGDGDLEILVSTYRQHVYAFDERGNIVDAVRLAGSVTTSPVPIVDRQQNRTDVLVTTAALLAYRLRPGPARSPYGKKPAPADVTLRPRRVNSNNERTVLVVDNPRGALVGVNLSMTGTSGRTSIKGRMTASSAFEIKPPPIVQTGPWSLQAVARDRCGRFLAERTWRTKLPPRDTVHAVPPGALTAWPTPPYGLFDAGRLVPCEAERPSGNDRGVVVGTLYRNEVDQGALIVASTLDRPVRARIVVEHPVGPNKLAFAGNIALREVVSTGTVNGEQAADALPAVGPAGLITIPAGRAVKIWLSVAARQAVAGDYHGQVRIAPLTDDAKAVALGLDIRVLPLDLPGRFPLTVCTWDYIPNRWFRTHITEVLHDMVAHGVNVFPRSAPVPRATADGKGQLLFDWSVLDAELKRLKGRGTILFQLGHPPIKSATKLTAAQRTRIEIAYLRQWRDHLKQHGWGYDDYAFYPVDEPGLHFGTNVLRFIEAAELFRRADPSFRVYTDPVPTLSWRDYQRIEPLLDVWCPNMRLVSGLLAEDPRMRRIMASGDPVWSYECVSQVKSLSPLRYNRANAWRAKFFGLDGIGFWTHSTTSADPWFAGKTQADEYALVYPGTVPVPSVRWEAVRDGLEDVAAIELLEARITAHKKSAAKRALVEQARAVLRIAETDMMELSDHAFMESRDYLRKGNRRIWHTWTDALTLIRHRARIARLTLALAE